MSVEVSARKLVETRMALAKLDDERRELDKRIHDQKKIEKSCVDDIKARATRGDVSTFIVGRKVVIVNANGDVDVRDAVIVEDHNLLTS